MKDENILKKLRKKENLSQEEIASLCGESQKNISQIETGKKAITAEICNKLVANFKKAASLKAVSTYQNKSEFISVPYLNNVDKHIQTGLDSIIEEYQEGIEAARMLKKSCKNKLSINQLTAQEKFDLLDHLEQIVDVYTANKMLLTIMAEMYEVDLSELEERHLEKLKEKKYYREEGEQ